MKTVLYIAIDSTLGGSTASLWNLIESVKGEVMPIVLFPEEGVGFDFFVENGIETYIYPFIKLYWYKKNRLADVWKRPWHWHYIRKWRCDIQCAWYVKKVLKGRKVDIVHTNTSPNDVGVMLSKVLRAKHVWHIREFADLHNNFDIYRGIPHLCKLINKADARIAISTAIRDRWQMRDKNTWIIHDAVRRKNEACFIPKKEKYVFFCSWYLNEAKGTRRAIIAFAGSGMAEEGFKLKLMGNCEEDYRQSLLATAMEYGVFDSIEFVPCQTEVKPWFLKAAAYIMASDCEGLGRVTAEAMFFGCPVIAHATGGTLDLVKERETGYLFDTIEECSALLRKVCLSDNGPMILRAQQFVKDNLSQEVYGPKIIEVYDSVMKVK